MSATFKNLKKKGLQTELRRLMNEHKSKKDVKPVSSPLAKYNENGDLSCILCKSIVRSAAVWPVHINSKQHRENIELAKKLKEKTNNFTKVTKRSLSPPNEVPSKKLKSILKKPETQADTFNAKNGENIEKNTLPVDFFNSKLPERAASKSIKLLPSKTSEEKLNKEETANKDQAPEVLPEGFFDDPKLDAKARNQEYKDPIEEEWEKFQKAIKEADDESAAIIAEDQDEATTERQIDEIDEQIKHLSKVLVLEQKKKEISIPNSARTVDIEDDTDVDESEFDEFLDWRSKKSFK